MEKGEEIIKGFFKERFGSLVAEELFRERMDRLKIANFENMDNQQRIATGQQMIEEICSTFLSPEKVRNMKLLFLLRFSLNEAGKKVTDALKKECDIRIESPEDITSAELEEYTSSLDSTDNTSFGYQLSAILDGAIIITMSNKGALELAKEIMQSMMGAEGDSDELNDLKLSAIGEFFTIILPVFTKTVGDAFDQEVLFAPMKQEEINSELLSGESARSMQLTIKTKVLISIGEFKTEGNVLFFVKKANGKIKEILDEAHKDPFEESPPRIVVKKTGNPRLDMAVLFSMLRIPEENIGFILKSMKKDSFDDFTYLDFSRFCKILIDEFIFHASDKKQRSIKANVLHILSLKKDTAYDSDGVEWV